MTPKQLKEKIDKELIIAYKNKARCFYSRQKAGSIFNELKIRFGMGKLYPLFTATQHLEFGEGDGEFNKECDILINSL